MIRIRNGAFETNSSSTHSIVISKAPVETFPSSINFNIDFFGWEHGEANPRDYLYTAILDICPASGWDDKLNIIKNVLDRHNIKYTFEEPKIEEYHNGERYLSFEQGGIDHCNELEDFVKTILSDEELLLKYLFGETYVYTGNDNNYYDDEISTNDVALGHVYDGNGNYRPNPYHNEDENYYFYKDN